MTNKTTSYRFPVTFLIALVLGLSSGSAQSNVTANASDLEQISFRFSGVAWDTSVLAEPLFVKDDDKFERIRLNTRFRSKEMRYKGSPQFFLYADRPKPDGTTYKAPVGSINVSANLSNILFVISKSRNGNSGPSYRIFAIDDSDSDFPYGALRVFNSTNMEAALKVGNEIKGLRPRQDAIFSPPLSDENSAVGVKIIVNVAGTLEEGYSTRISVRPDMRRLIFLVSEGEGDSLRLRLKIINETKRTPARDQAVSE